MSGLGLRRLQHLVLWVSNVERSVRFYRDVLGFEVKRRHPRAAFLKIPGTPDDHHLGLFEQTGVAPPDLREAGALVGESDHGASLSLYARDPDGLEFELFWTVPGAESIGTRPLDLEGELARRGLPVP
jgi:catechol-2,3-dioxygenase